MKTYNLALHVAGHGCPWLPVLIGSASAVEQPPTAIQRTKEYRKDLLYSLHVQSTAKAQN